MVVDPDMEDVRVSDLAWHSLETNYEMRVLLLAALPCLLLAIVTDTDTRSSVAIELKKRRGGLKRRFGSTVLTQTDMAYTGKVTVGNPPQEFEVIFDTGSGNLIVPGINCTVSACTQHKRFDDAQSKTSHAHHCDGGEVGSNEVPNDLVVTFGTGEVRGHCFRDRVCLGDKMCAPAKFISSFEESNDPFEWVSFDGILGLGLDSLAQSTDFSIMQRLEHGDSIKSPLFAFFFARAKEEKSQITFGDIQQDKLGSKMYWFKVSGKAGYWQVEIQDIFLDDTAQNICKGCHVAIDTGSSEIAGPQHVIDHLSDKLSIKNCKERAKLPKLGFAIKEHGSGGKTKLLSLSPEHYTHDQPCNLALMPLDIPPPNGPLFVLGVPFLEKYYTVFDRKHKRLGFAVAKHAHEKPETFLEAGSGTGVVSDAYCSAVGLTAC
ncbi:ctse-b [Symbiodinium sp. CCMP2456]|nr:ctse-b [Symbiodinium sp. CCMP2456]